MITQERVKEVLIYDAHSGIFTNRIDRAANSKKGCAVGSDKGNGYLTIHIDRVSYLAHRIAWLYVHGYMPENSIDHINRVRDDNRIENLREASRSCNGRNAKVNKKNTSSVTGVYWSKQGRYWCAEVVHRGKGKYVGCSPDFIEACALRLAGEQAEDYESCYTGRSLALLKINEWVNTE